MKPTVTIIIPAWNSHSYIKQAIDSALDQKTAHVFEVILVDDGSTDNSLDIYRQYQDQKFIYFLRPHLGQASSKNFAINNSKGEIIIILDSDDYLATNAVETVATYFKNNPRVTYAYSEHIGVSIDSKEIYHTNKLDYYQKNISKFDEDLILHCCFHGHLMAMKKNVFDKVGIFNETLNVGVDYDWILRYCETFTPGYISSYLYYYREHGKGINTLIEKRPEYIENIIKSALERRGCHKKVSFAGRDEVGYRNYIFN